MTDIDSARFGAEWNRNFFQNSATPGGVIQADSELDDDDFDRIRDRWLESHRGVNRAHRVAVLEGGLTWVPNSMSVRDMDFEPADDGPGCDPGGPRHAQGHDR